MIRSGEIDLLHYSFCSMKGTSFSYFPIVQEDMFHLTQLSIYADASEILARFINWKIPPFQYQRSVQYYGDKSGDLIEYTSQKPFDKAIHCTMIDGSMVFADDGSKELKVGLHFSSDDIPKVGNETRREISQPSYYAQKDDSDSFTTNMDVLIEKTVPKGSKHVFLNDEAIWIENRITKQLPNAISILDFLHGIEHVSYAAKVLTPDTQVQQRLMIRVVATRKFVITAYL